MCTLRTSKLKAKVYETFLDSSVIRAIVDVSVKTGP